MRFVRVAAYAALLTWSLSTPAPGANITWIGANNNWTDGVANNANWSPADEPDPDDVAIFNTNNTVSLGSSNTIMGLTMSGGIDLDTSGFSLTVGGLVQLTGSSTNLIIRGAASEVLAEDATINSGATIELDGGALKLSDAGLVTAGNLIINAGGSLVGHGTASVLDAPLLAGTTISNNGTITALTRVAVVGQSPPANTLTLAASGTARIDLDGSSEIGAVNVNRNQTLAINGTLADAFNGTLTMTQNTTFDVSSAWTLGPGGAINIDNGAVISLPPVGAGASTIAGGTLSQTGGAINVLDDDGTLQFDAQLAATGGNFVNNGLVIFNADAVIGVGANMTMPTNNSSLTVGAGRTVTVNQANFNADGGGQTTNVITVSSGGLFNLNLGAGADESLSGLLRLNGGTINVTTIDDTWSIDGSVQVGASTGVSQISGEALTIANANVSVGNGSTLRITAPLTLGGGGSITGTGTLAFNNAANVTSATTLNMAGGTVDLDGTDTVGDQINVRAPLVINAATLESFGRTNAGGGVNTILVDALSAGATGSLTVNLDNPNAEWTLNPQGSLALVSTNAPLTLLSGNAVNLNGSVTVTGTAGTAARVDIAGTVNIQTASPNGGLLLQGGTIAGPNRLEGGQINGPGALQATSGRALEGFGTINAPIKFGGTAELIASGGMLNVNGTVDDVGVVRVKNASTLNLGQPLLTAITDNGIVMEGGTLQGSAITTSSTDAANRSLRGVGTVSSAVTNNGFIQAIGGTLSVTNAASDWDGSGSGHLRASGGGTLQLTDAGTFAFGGSVIAVEDSRVFTNGFGLNMSSTSSLLLTQGTYEASASVDIGGTVVIGAGAPSTVKVTLNSFLEFEPTATVLLNGNLRLESNNARIRAGAAFGGAGAIVVPAGPNTLVLEPNANVNVLVDNAGTLFPGGIDGVGRVDLKDYQQRDSGKLFVEIEGTGLNQFDRFVVNGIAQLDGYLNVDLDGGFVPAAGNTFNIIAATAGVAGAFDYVDIQGFPLGLTVKVNYLPTIVQLEVVNTPIFSADFDKDGDVDPTDLQIWKGAYALNPLGDADGDGDSDGSDFLVWQRQLGSKPAVAAGGAVPEPSAYLLGMVSLAAAAGVWRRRGA